MPVPRHRSGRCTAARSARSRTSPAPSLGLRSTIFTSLFGMRNGVTLKVCGHPPFNAQILLHGHEDGACQASKKALAFPSRQPLPQASNLAGLRKSQRPVRGLEGAGPQSAVLDVHLLSRFQAPLGGTGEDEFWLPLFGLPGTVGICCFRWAVGGIRGSRRSSTATSGPSAGIQVKTRLGSKKPPGYRKSKRPPTRWGVLVEKPDLTRFKVRFGKLTLKIYAQGERALRLEAIGQSTRALPGNRSWPPCPDDGGSAAR